MSYGVGDAGYSPNAFVVLGNKVELEADVLTCIERTPELLSGNYRNKSALAAMNTLYHEATYAYLWLFRHTEDVRKIVEHGVAYYTGPILENGEMVSDSYRVFTEAAASYVGCRVSTYLHTLSVFDSVELAVRSGRRDSVWANKEVTRAVRDYDNAMRDRKHGYEPSLPFGYGRQIPCEKPISDELKAFLDSRVLEGRISDTFAGSAEFEKKVADINALYVGQASNPADPKPQK
jgi:hypothetical protein